MPDPNSERIGKTIRKHIRIEAQLGIHFMVEGAPEQTVYTAQTKNISRGGVCFSASLGKTELIALMRGTRPRLMVSLFLGEDAAQGRRENSTTWISCRIRWMMTPSLEENPALVGLAFEELPEADAEKIDSYIEDFVINIRESVQEVEAKIYSQFKI